MIMDREVYELKALPDLFQQSELAYQANFCKIPTKNIFFSPNFFLEENEKNKK